MLDYEIKVVKPTDEFYKKQYEKIAEENNLKTLSHMAEFYVCAVKNDEVLGYALLKSCAYGYNDISICEICEKKEYLNKKIRESVIEYVLKHSKSYDVVIRPTTLQKKQNDSYLLDLGFIKKNRFGVISYQYATKFIKERQLLEFSEDDREMVE